MDIGQRLTRELDEALARLRQSGVAIDELPAPVGDGAAAADPLDDVQLAVDRDISFATRSLLFERVNRLASALDRFREGRYGVCDECAEPIATARLAALPEVTTCVRCQDRLERATRHQLVTTVLTLDDEE